MSGITSASGSGERYLERAAVLSYFDPDWIEPGLVDDPNGQASDEMADFLMRCARVVGSDQRPHWTLPDGDRISVLRSTPQSELGKVLREVATRPTDSIQRALEQFLGGALPPIAAADTDVLDAMLQLARWFGDQAPGLPPTGTVAGELERRHATEPLRRLLLGGFVGRMDLRARLLAHLVDDGDRPFVVHGPGGTGKSTTLAWLLFGERPEPKPLFAYLNFDRSALAIADPWSLTDEMLRQLGFQLDDVETEIATLRQEIRQSSRSRFGWDASSRGVQSEFGVDNWLLDRIEIMLPAAGRFVVVLDTFEEVQRRDISYTLTIFEYIKTLRRRFRQMRTVVAGRAPVPEAQGYDWRLGELEPADARTLLLNLTQGSGVVDDDITTALELVGGNPLSIRLAAEALRRRPRDLLRFVDVVEGNVQGHLYARILDHIGDPQVRAVAHPGLVVRRLTPEVIRSVLARPCGLTLRAKSDAERIFWALAREASLVEPSQEGDGALVHRSDVRAMMLPGLQRDEPTKVARIHRGAVRFYRQQYGPIARREELYHRLMLGQTARTIQARWDDGIGPELAASIDEFPASSQVFLAVRVPGIRIPEAVRESADNRNWARATEAAIRRRIAHGLLSDALVLVRERRGPKGESLHPELEIEVLERLGDFEGALGLARSEKALAARRGDDRSVRWRILDEVRIFEVQGLFQEALVALDVLVDATADQRRRINDEEEVLDELVVLTTWLRLVRRLRLGQIDIQKIQEETVQLAESTPGRILSRRPSLLRDLAAEIGPRSPKTVEVAVRVLGIEEETRHSLSEEVQAWPGRVSSESRESTAGASEADEMGNNELIEQRYSLEGLGSEVGVLYDRLGHAPSIDSAISESYRRASDAAVGYHDFRAALEAPRVLMLALQRNLSAVGAPRLGVTLGLAFALQSGRLRAMLVDRRSAAQVTIVLEWA